MIFQRIFENIKQIQTPEGVHLKAEIDENVTTSSRKL